MTANQEDDELIGQPLFGSYVIKRQIGKGGMGAVYAVESAELGKTLAMKVLLGDATRLSRTTAGRFVAEARAASAINHRNIITILDSAQLPDGRRYILMEYLEGPTLREFSKQMGPLSPDVALAILAQVCSGLQAAHDRGIIHRDLKPSNILITPQPDNPYFTKILDFGIAKLTDPNLGSVETHTTALAGTPSYMSPEQARALKDVDHRTDIYALGVMAYRLFCGKLPYRAHSIGELVHQQTTAQPESLAVRRGDLPPAWIDLVHSAMAMNPADRPQSAHEFATRMIAATPQGESIARGAASLLFATETGSFSNTSKTGPSASFSHPTLPDDSHPPAAATKATVAIRNAAGSNAAATPPMAEWEGQGQQLGAQQQQPFDGSVQTPSAPSRRALWLGLWFSMLIVVSSLVTWLVLRDTSAKGASSEETAEETPTAEEASTVEETPTAEELVFEPDDPDENVPGRGGTPTPIVQPLDVTDVDDKKNSEPDAAAVGPRTVDAKKPRRPAKKTEAKPAKSDAKEDTTPTRTKVPPKIDEEDLFNLRK